jgi:methionyl-tRNA synthetase
VIKENKQSAATTVYTALKAIDSLKILFAPFLPFSSAELHRTLGYREPIFGELHIDTYKETERSHEALVYDGSRASGRWAPSQLEAGRKFEKPRPLFKKLDEEVVEQERSRLGD